MTGYKQIIENMVDSSVHAYVEKKVGGYVSYPDKVTLYLEKDFDHPQFKAEIRIGWKGYTVSGYVDTYGDVRICSVSFDRMRCQEKDKNGDWITESAKPVHELLYGDELERFKFDR